MYLITGLGNPGITHKKNRHNIGFLLLDRIAETAGGSFRKFSSSSQICRVSIADNRVVLLKPNTFMNGSGLAVRELVNYYDVDLSKCLIAYDEVALPLGRIRFRRQGSAGGHRGMQSVIEFLETSSIPRLRIGILGESPRKDLADYVLGNFKRPERKILSGVLDHSIQGIYQFISEGIEKVMSLYNPEERPPDLD